MITCERTREVECAPALIDSVESALANLYPDNLTQIREEAHDKALRTMANLPSLVRGYVYRMKLGEVKRYEAHNLKLNSHAVDAVFSNF